MVSCALGLLARSLAPGLADATPAGLLLVLLWASGASSPRDAVKQLGGPDLTAGSA